MLNSYRDCLERPRMVRENVRLVARGVHRGRQPTGEGAKKIVVPAKSGARGGSN